MKMISRIITIAAVLLMPLVAHAQTAFSDDPRAGLVSVGAFVGGELDTPDDWLLFGGDGRINLGSMKMELNPRVSYRHIEDGSVVQIDLNLLKNFELARPGKLRPFAGIGGALRRLSIDNANISDSKVGLNLISGARLAMKPGSGYEPFFQAQYTVINDELNPFSIVVGVSFSLR
jgi:hypothetical protein